MNRTKKLTQLRHEGHRQFLPPMNPHLGAFAFQSEVAHPNSWKSAMLELVHRHSPVKDGYFAHAIPGQIDSPRKRPAIASEVPGT
jgi:hypothetical protein